MAKTIHSERVKTEQLGTQRWEDEGGQMLKDSDSSPDQLLVQPAPVSARRRVVSLQWSERFVIQPFQPGNGMTLIVEKHAK